MQAKKRWCGFTLVELLLAMAILGILMSAIIAMTSGFLGFSRHVNSVNDQLAQLNDAAGYVALNGRRAMEIIGSANGGAASADVAFGADTFTCSTTSADGSCMAVVVPTVDSSTAAITGYELLAYRVVPISDWADNPGLAGGWSGDDTPLMLEYHVPLSCSALPCSLSSLTADRASLVIPNLYLENNDGTDVAPFEILNTREFVLSLRTRGTGQNAQRMVPNDGPIVLDVTLRP